MRTSVTGDSLNPFDMIFRYVCFMFMYADFYSADDAASWTPTN